MAVWDRPMRTDIRWKSIETLLDGSEAEEMIGTCPGCGVAVGQLHDLFCTKERCPFCGGQLASCECIVTVLDLNDDEREAVDEYEDDSVEPLRGIMGRWHAALEAEGRIPFGASS